jgi:23S rRNA (cytidine1920-2'-O)/16S rRNA (cytidine1409-2'-O)-methyltransferase
LKDRLDKVLVSRGLVKSREMARALIMEGKVSVDGQKLTKAGSPVREDSEISLEENGIPYVSRGGLKLEAALDFFAIDVKNMIIMDVGSSTGGFTDCMLKRGAEKVYCIDVGYGQLAWSLRNDPRIVLLERTNVRYLDQALKEQKSESRQKELEDLIQGNIDMATIDVSFISLTKVVPAILPFIKQEGAILALVKPQFEIGKGLVGKGGIVREEEKRLQTLRDVQESLRSLGLESAGDFQSPVPGQKGNIEFFLYMKKGAYGRG